MKTEMKERLSKLQFPNDTGMSNVREIVLPDIQFCSEENIFKMVVKLSDEETKQPIGQALNDTRKVQERAKMTINRLLSFLTNANNFMKKKTMNPKHHSTPVLHGWTKTP